MALTYTEFMILTTLQKQGLLPHAPDLLEFGESNWYGDITLEQLTEYLTGVMTNGEKKYKLLEQLKSLELKANGTHLFDVAKLFFQAVLDYKSYTAIDLSGTDASLKADLNYPIDLGKEFDVVFNFGTAEHVFNVYQFFKTVHACTKANGLMLHGMPFSGWYDHGFYNFQPTFYLDLAIANDYGNLGLFYVELGNRTILNIRSREHVVEMAKNKKISEFSLIYSITKMPEKKVDFKIPTQSFYSANTSKEVQEAWHTLRA